MRRRDMEENCRFAKYLVSAIDNAEQAVSNIFYPDYPEINKETIEKIQTACNILEEVFDNTNIFKP